MLSKAAPNTAYAFHPSSQILAALQVLGRGYRFEDVSRMALMSESTAQASFHTFCRCVASELYEEHVSMPTGAALEKVMHQYDRLGFTGAVGSTDVTHIRWGSCPSSHARAYTGRGGLATIAYQVTVDHSGRALAVSKGFAGAANDRTILRYDLAVQMVREDPVYRGRMFSLYNEDGTWTEHKGVYLLVENGHHQVNDVLCRHIDLYFVYIYISVYIYVYGTRIMSDVTVSLKQRCTFGIVKEWS